MASLEGQAAHSGPREPKRLESVADDWCDSGLGSLSENQLSQLQEEGAGLLAHTDVDMEPRGQAVTPEPATLSPGGHSKALADEDGAERLDSALGDSLGGDEDVGSLAEGVGAVRLEGEVAAVAPEAWLHHVLGFVTEDGDTYVPEWATDRGLQRRRRKALRMTGRWKRHQKEIGPEIFSEGAWACGLLLVGWHRARDVCTLSEFLHGKPCLALSRSVRGARSSHDCSCRRL